MQFQVGQSIIVEQQKAYGDKRTWNVKVLDNKVPTLVEDMKTCEKYFIDKNHLILSKSTVFMDDGDKKTFVYTPNSLYFYNVDLSPVQIPTLQKCYDVSHPSFGTIVVSPFKPVELKDIMSLLGDEYRKVAIAAKATKEDFTVEERKQEEYTVITKTPTGFVHTFFKTTFSPSIKTIEEFFASAQDIVRDIFTIPKDAQGWVEKGHIDPIDMNVINNTIAADKEYETKTAALNAQMAQMYNDNRQLWRDNKLASQYKDIYEGHYYEEYPLVLLETVLFDLEKQQSTLLFSDFNRFNSKIKDCKEYIKQRRNK